MKRFLAIAVLLSVASGFGLTAWAAGGGSDQGQSDAPAAGSTEKADKASGGKDAEASEENGIHGGPIERFHAPGGCGLVSIGGLPGNWTHGDYVTAVDALGDATLVVEAAHSDCGKPTQAVGHGGGPPAHALAHALNHRDAKGEKDEATGGS